MTWVPIDDPHVTAVPGFLAAGVTCGLKKGGDLDLCLLACDVACTSAALFTTNRVQAAPVLYDKRLLEGGSRLRAVLINSGNANACTGQQGLRDVERSAELVASKSVAISTKTNNTCFFISLPPRHTSVDAMTVPASRVHRRTPSQPYGYSQALCKLGLDEVVEHQRWRS